MSADSSSIEINHQPRHQKSPTSLSVSRFILNRDQPLSLGSLARFRERGVSRFILNRDQPRSARSARATRTVHRVSADSSSIEINHAFSGMDVVAECRCQPIHPQSRSTTDVLPLQVPHASRCQPIHPQSRSTTDLYGPGSGVYYVSADSSSIEINHTALANKEPEVLGVSRFILNRDQPLRVSVEKCYFTACQPIHPQSRSTTPLKLRFSFSLRMCQPIHPQSRSTTRGDTGKYKVNLECQPIHPQSRSTTSGTSHHNPVP